ncbi:MAG: hypothetical protein V1851_00220 [Patescibacteria group bacterium]
MKVIEGEVVGIRKNGIVIVVETEDEKHIFCDINDSWSKGLDVELGDRVEIPIDDSPYGFYIDDDKNKVFISQEEITINGEKFVV